MFGSVVICGFGLRESSCPSYGQGSAMFMTPSRATARIPIVKRPRWGRSREPIYPRRAFEYLDIDLFLSA